MNSETGNARAKKEQGSNPIERLQACQSRDPDKSNARDRESRNGGASARNL